MGGQYSIDVAGFLSTTDSVATELESLGPAVHGGLDAIDDLAEAVADERGLASALRGATEERRRTGPNAVNHGGAVVLAACRVALAYVQADDDMALATSRAENSSTFPRTPGGRHQASAR